MIIGTAQGQSSNTGILIGARVGAAKVLTEVSPSFSLLTNEFDHKVAPAFDIEISKLFLKHWEVGTGFGLTYLKGDTDDPQFSAEGIHYKMNYSITEPVEYKNELIGGYFFLGYYFRSFSRYRESGYLEPFIRAGVGCQSYNSKFSYVNSDDGGLIFGKNIDIYPTLYVWNFRLSSGVKTHLSENFIMTASFALVYATHDFLDVVHNYNSYGSRTDTRGIYSEFKIGFLYHFKGNTKHRKRRRPNYSPFSGR